MHRSTSVAIERLHQTWGMFVFLFWVTQAPVPTESPREHPFPGVQGDLCKDCRDGTHKLRHRCALSRCRYVAAGLAFCYTMTNPEGSLKDRKARYKLHHDRSNQRQLVWWWFSWKLSFRPRSAAYLWPERLWQNQTKVETPTTSREPTTNQNAWSVIVIHLNNQTWHKDVYKACLQVFGINRRCQIIKKQTSSNRPMIGIQVSRRCLRCLVGRCESALERVKAWMQLLRCRRLML